MKYLSNVYGVPEEPKPAESPFGIGDWVELRGKEKNPSIIRGYILNNDGYTEKSYVQAVWSNIPNINNRNWVKWENLTNLQQETDTELLIDLALETKEQEWFTQLTRGME